jgi:hypothetical protein
VKEARRIDSFAKRQAEAAKRIQVRHAGFAWTPIKMDSDPICLPRFRMDTSQDRV